MPEWTDRRMKNDDDDGDGEDNDDEQTKTILILCAFVVYSCHGVMLRYTVY